MNKKWLKIGIPILIVMTVLTIGLGTSYALATEKDAGVVNSQSVAFDPEYDYPNCQGPQNCPYVQDGNCPGYFQDNDSGQFGGCCDSWGDSATNDASNQPQYRGCWK